MRNCFFYWGAAALLMLAGCKANQIAKAPEPVLITLGGKPVFSSEFAYVYNKNNNNTDNAYSNTSIREYLDLYTNFKLKVLDAESRGLDTTTAFRTELDGYKQQLAQPYLTEKSVTDKLIREAYDRMQKEINATHILIGVAPDADPKDTLAAYNKIADLRKRLVAGEDIEKLAVLYSEDASAKENKGNLGYFTALQMVYPFEDAAYKTSPGQLSNPVRTRFGYHLIKVNNIRNAQGEIKVAHIMVRATPGMPKADSVAAKRKIDEIYTRVQRQEKWEKLVVQFSEDASSSQNGGELPWFGTGRMIPSFEEVAFKLQQPGEIARPVQTPYGWHIIKLIERRGLPTYEDMETSLRNRIAKDSRSELNKMAFIKRIRTENNFREIAAAKNYAVSKADSGIVKGTWKNTFSDKETGQALFTIKDKRYTIKDFFKYAEQNQRARPGSSPAHTMNLLYDSFAEQSLLHYEKENLENKHVDYKMLVREYRDGILLFQLMDEKVWSKAVEDSVGLKTFFQNNRDNYKWDTRAEATILSAANPAILARAQQQLALGRFEVRKNAPAPIGFEAGKDALTGPSKRALDELAAKLVADTSLTLRVTGRLTTKEAGQPDNNLAQKRANQIQTYLTSKGIAANRVRATTDKKPTNQRTALLNLYSSDLRVLEQNLNEANPLNLQAAHRMFTKGENKVLDEMTWQPGTTTLEKDGRTYFIRIHRVLSPGLKQLSETRGQVTSDYQAFLEKEWLTELRQRFPVKVNQTEVDKLVKQ